MARGRRLKHPYGAARYYFLKRVSVYQLKGVVYDYVLYSEWEFQPDPICTYTNATTA